jgi:hypothetical protein
MNDAPHSRKTRAPIALQSCLPFVIGLLIAGAIAAYMLSGRIRAKSLPVLNRARFDDAWQSWQAKGPDSYTISIQVEGRQPAVYTCTVQNGEVVLATRNDRPLTQVRTMGTWSVPGMFDTIEYDVRVIEGEDLTEQQRAVTDLLLRAKFDEEFGYPSQYMRSDFAMKTTTRWTVTDFEILQSDALDDGIETLQKELIDFEPEDQP